MTTLDNFLELHTECNIALQFPTSLFTYFGTAQFEIDSKYIGIAKLCCGFCYKYLEVQGYEYRGTHGVCDQAWKMYSKHFEEIFKAQVLGDSSIEVAAGKEVFQHRRLSFDGFEKDIPLKQFQDCTNPAELKDKLGLTYETKTSAITQTTTASTTTSTIEAVLPSYIENTTFVISSVELGGKSAEFSTQGL